MLHGLRSRLTDEGGYTLVELLVVVLVIGVLASIALPVFLGQREKSQDASAKSDAANMARHMEMCATTTGTYVGCEVTLTPARTGLSIGSGPGQVEIVGTPTARDYVVVAHSSAAAGTRTFQIARAASGQTRTCAPSGGGCIGTSW